EEILHLVRREREARDQVEYGIEQCERDLLGRGVDRDRIARVQREAAIIERPAAATHAIARGVNAEAELDATPAEWCGACRSTDERPQHHAARVDLRRTETGNERAQPGCI